jgi:7-cyano-7-deazaguanine synthase
VDVRGANGESRPAAAKTDSVAVLFSAGLDSAVLLAHTARENRDRAVQPIYVSAGLAWEREELAMADRLLTSSRYATDRILRLVSLSVDMRDVYPASHWAVRGEPPAYDTPDEDVYIDGRNVVLLSKASVYMARAGISRVMIGPLAGNPFPDASSEFFAAMGRALSLGLAAPVQIDAPFAALHKDAVISLGHSLGVPFELTVSCMQPRNGVHCGRCSKCRERIEAFRDAGIADPAAYAIAVGK